MTKTLMTSLSMPAFLAGSMISIAATPATAGVAFIGYDTGNNQCTNGYSSKLDFCRASSSTFTTYEFCQSTVCEVCG
jgi:hypothetical protein